MIDIDKVRLWSVYFSRMQIVSSMPYPNMVVEEVEKKGYRMPQYSPEKIPSEVGGQITLTLAGRGVLSVNGVTYSCVPGTAFLYRDCDPAVSYYYPPDGTEEWRFVWINFMGKESSRVIEDVNRLYGYFFQMGQNSVLEEELLAYRHWSGRNLFYSPLEGAERFFHFLHLLCDSQQQRGQHGENRLVVDIQNEFSQSFGEALSTSNLAKKIGISREHLSKKFHAETGRTLRDYRAEQRISQAMFLLMKSNLSCKEIAQMCHYGSYSSFFRSFSRIYKMSPEEFRKKHVVS